MKIQAYMPVFNEADVLPYVLAHLRQQGVGVHIIDGWSTDGSYEYAESLQNLSRRNLYPRGLTVERFPAEAASPTQVCTDILRRIEDLAETSRADWLLYTDADEWRRSPVAGETLAQGIERVDAAGFNAIDFRVYAFFCVDDMWRGDPEKYFQHYNESDMICKIPNRKCWKNVGRVALAGGGHEVMFRGMKVAPERFTMKHYPFRSPEQARRKLETRLARRCHDEHRRGWGVHYDEPFPPTFCWNPEDLQAWSDSSTPLPSLLL